MSTVAVYRSCFKTGCTRRSAILLGCLLEGPLPFFSATHNGVSYVGLGRVFCGDMLLDLG